VVVGNVSSEEKKGKDIIAILVEKKATLHVAISSGME